MIIITTMLRLNVTGCEGVGLLRSKDLPLKTGEASNDASGNEDWWKSFPPLHAIGAMKNTNKDFDFSNLTCF